MAEDMRRIKAVAAALRGIRERVEDDTSDFWTTDAYDKWIGMLDGAIEGDLDNVVLGEAQMHRTDFLTHLDAAIAFLEAYEKEQGGGILPLKSKGLW